MFFGASFWGFWWLLGCFFLLGSTMFHYVPLCSTMLYWVGWFPVLVGWERSLPAWLMTVFRSISFHYLPCLSAEMTWTIKGSLATVNSSAAARVDLHSRQLGILNLNLLMRKRSKRTTWLHIIWPCFSHVVTIGYRRVCVGIVGLIQSNFGPWSSLTLEPPICWFFPHFHQTKCLGVWPTAVSISGFWVVNHSGHRMVGTKSKLRPVEKWSRLGCFSAWALFWRCQSSSLRAATVRCLGLLLAINLPGVRRGPRVGDCEVEDFPQNGEANVIPDIRYISSGKKRSFAHVLQCLYFRNF